MAQFIPTSPANFEPETRTGGCLCGAARFEYHGVPLEAVHVLSCDCNLCAVLGSINYYTKPGTIKLIGGTWQTLLKQHTAFHEYYERDLIYSFCPTCGSVFGAEGPDFVMINARLFDGIDGFDVGPAQWSSRSASSRCTHED
ncbi:hypothetical protein AURDEDRAFT_125853 [Auricularia subglabra TFB-10046 SS5]|nr:hypothetical protein AURDEDRAFT_125853 [Auricularia subglabra TFB-10046 SS5]